MIQKSDHSIYISHAWGGESEEVVREIYTRCRKRGLNVIMDHQDLGYRESITSFMKSLGQADAIILVVSNKYLHSEYCMFELLQIYENKNMIQRIFPVVLDEVSIAKSAERLELVRYWENETEHLESKIRELKNLSYIEGITDDLNLYQKIRNNIANLTRILKDINTLNIKLHKENDYNDLIQAVERYLKNIHSENEPGIDTSPQPEKGQNFRESGPSHGTELDSAKRWWTNIFRAMPYIIILLMILGGAFIWLMQNVSNDGTLDELSSTYNTTQDPGSRVEFSALNPDSQVRGNDSDNQSTVSESSTGQSLPISKTDQEITSQPVKPPKTKLNKLTDNERTKNFSVPGSSEPVQLSQSHSEEGENSLNKMEGTTENVPLNANEHLSGTGNQKPEAEMPDVLMSNSRIEKVYVPVSYIFVRFSQDISSNHVEKGDLVYLSADKPVWSEDRMITNRNARVRARVIDAKASHQGSRGSLGIRLEAIESIDGQWLDLNYHDILEKRRDEIVFTRGTVLENVKLESTTINLKTVN